ncbi:MAG: integrase [Oleiphilaceae bacterium]|jgi:integrase
MRHSLIATNDTLKIGKLTVYVDNNGELIRQVKNQKAYPGIKLLVDENSQPVFHVNAFLLSRRIVDNLKDIEPLAKAMLLYFRFLATNNMEWDDLDAPLDRNPIFLFRNHLHQLISGGVYHKTTAASYLGVVRRFYMFCHRHRYIDRLPFQVEGINKYGKSYTDCSIQAPSGKRRLKPLNGRELGYVYETWNAVSIEFRLLTLLAQYSGLRSIEAADIKKRLFVIPKSFKGNTVTEMRIGPSNNCKTKFDTDREISMPVWLIRLFNEYHESQRYKQRASEYCEITGDYDIPAVLTINSQPFSTKTMTALWNKLSKAIRAKFDPHFNHKFHDNRATFGCNKLDALLAVKGITKGQALATLKAEMGHTKLDTTMLYLEHWEGHPELNAATEVMMDFDEKILSGMEF